MEAANQKKKLFVCKYCNKRYPCGKSLGGHIRTHMNNGNSAEGEGEGDAKFNIDKILSGRNIKKDLSFEAGGQSSYGLRENPKRTRRFVDSKTLNLQQEMVCKECGKSFQSLKALCGHMACHSEKHLEGGDLKQKLVMNGESETDTENETLAPSSKLRRSKGTGSMTTVAYSSFVDVGNGSSSVSEIEQEQEEVAMCLMMLSRDSSGCKKGLNSFADSSDNNSVVLEAKSSSIDMKISAKNGVKCVSNGNEFVEMKKAKDRRKLKSAEIDDVSDNSDSGYFRNGPKKAESDASFHGFVDRASMKYGPRKRAKKDSSSPQIFHNNAQEKSEFVCLTCNKVFHSPRSLWGHTATHSKINGCCESINKSSENSIETDSFPVHMPNSKDNKSVNGKNNSVDKRLGSKKSKGHECPFCFRVFKSGQALGGHKRSHFVGGGEDRTVVIKQEVDEDEIHGLIDLNLPVRDAEFSQW